jgi:GWxTD domain-containing protein
MSRPRCCNFLLPILFLCFGLTSGSVQSQERTTVRTVHNASLDNSAIYKKWLNEDVHWIITDQECADFTKLSSDKQRDEFVAAFWERRNPTPGSAANPFKESHYQRLAYANTHFADRVPGWKTDRGRVFIM